jgi:hypothetical protein
VRQLVRAEKSIYRKIVPSMASQSEPLSIGAAAEAYQVAMEEQARDAKATAQVTPQAPAELDNITPAAAAALSQASVGSLMPMQS